MIAVIKDAYGPALTEIGQASAHRLIETELDPMCELCDLRVGDLEIYAGTSFRKMGQWDQSKVCSNPMARWI